MADRKVFGNQGPVDPNLKRSTFDKSFLNNLTLRPGYAYPCLLEECPANSSYSIDVDFAFDMMPLWYPTQNNITAHLSFYRIPFRILMKHFKRFFGQIGKDGRINGSLNYEMPFIKRAPGWCEQGSLADYLGLPTNYFATVDKFVELHRSKLKYMILRNGRDDHKIVNYSDIGSSTESIIGSGGFGFLFDSVKGKLADASSIKLSFVTSSDVSLSDIQTALLSAQTTFSLLWRNNNHNQSSGNYSSDFEFGVSYDIEEGNTYVVNGISVKTFYLVIDIEPSDIERFNSDFQYYNNSGQFLLFWTDNSQSVPGQGLGYFMINRSENFPQISADASLVSFDNPEDTKTTLIQPNITAYGVFGSPIILMSVPTNGNRNHFCSVDGADPVIPINALPFRAYQFVMNYYFRNSRIDPFMKYSDETGNLQPCYDEYITNDGDGADETTPLELVRVPWEYDMFTTAVKEPFFGNAPLVGISTASNSDGELSSATFTMRSDSGESYSFTCKTDGSGKLVGIDYSSASSAQNGNTPNTPLFDALNYAIDAGITISDFRNANALTRWMEKQQRSGVKYSNLLEEFFGTRPPLGEEFPTYLGGVTRRVMVNKITNTAQSDGNPLGDFAGTGSVSGSSKRIRMFTSEPCYILGIIYFTVTPLYSQMLPKHFIKSKLLDYYNPLFANISPQPIYTKQLAPLQLSAEEVDEVFGYGRPYADYVSRQDEVHGEFRGSMGDFLFQRLFKEKPRLNKSFIEINSADLTNIFANEEDNDKFFGQIYFSIRAKLPIPRFSVPQII